MRLFTLPAAIILAAAILGCGSSWKGRGGAPSEAPLALGPMDNLYVALPEISDSIAARLTPLGWGDGRFQAELLQEVRYQFQRKGVSLTEDSAHVASLAIRIESYGIQRNAEGYRGVALLRKADAERSIEIQKAMLGKEELERPDPTMDHIRAIAQSLVSEAYMRPKPRKSQEEERIWMWMVF